MTRYIQSAAVNHVKKFVADELVIDAKGFCRLPALFRLYWDWCEARRIVHRRLPGSLLLLHLEKDFNLRCGMTYVKITPGEKEPTGRVYALIGARLHDRTLNAMTLSRSMHERKRDLIAKPWTNLIEGIVPDRLDDPKIVDADEDDDESFDDE